MTVRNGKFEFILKNNVLLGCYLNEHTDGIFYPECAKSKTSKTDNSFEGQYDSAWFENGSNAHNANLEITKEVDFYKVQWKDKVNGNIRFEGRATLEDDVLRGSFVSV